MATNLIRRYIWLADTINRAGRISLAEINRRWVRSDMSDGLPIPLRTFHNHRNAIEEIFGISIVCHKPTNEYYIENSDDIADNAIARWLLNGFATANLLSENAAIRDRIIMEDIPSAQRYLDPILAAMRENQSVRMQYHPFYDDEPHEVVLLPYFVKMYERRWYVYGSTAENPTVKVYALDRIAALEVADERFALPDGFSAADHLATSAGITTYPGIQPRRIVIKCTGQQPAYLRALPLHSSQCEEERHEGWSLFSFYVAPTNEFYRKILSHREFMEIVSPAEVRDEYAQILSAMLALHK